MRLRSPQVFRGSAAVLIVGVTVAFAGDDPKQTRLDGEAGTDVVNNGQTTTGAESSQNDGHRIEGHGKCIDCHKQETKAWLASRHAGRAFDLLRVADPARDYAKKLGIRPTDIARNSMCVDCHATRQIDQVGRQSVIGAVSCESCHGAAGGEDGWLNRHAVYGPRGTTRNNETDERYKLRTHHSRQAGQLGSSQLYQLVKNCYSCHVVKHEALVNAGHKSGDQFVLLPRILGQVRHNFVLDSSKNAVAPTLWTDSLRGGPGRNASGRIRVLFVLGQMVDLETSLRNLSMATAENDFTDAMIDRIEGAFELLAEDILDEVEDTPLPEIKDVVKVVEPIWEGLDDDGFNADDNEMYLSTARDVAKAAQMFATRDGNKLMELDQLDLIPEGPFKDVYQP